MAENGVADVLRKLATGTAGRSDTARLRDIYDQVEAALAAGVTHAAILEALHADGFQFTLAGFQSALYRMRRKAGGRKRDRPQSATQAPAAQASEGEGEGDLSDLDPRARRERMASRYVKDAPTNPLLERLTKEKKV